MLREKLSEWIEKEREKGNARLTVSTVGVLSDFCYWLESDAELHVHPTEAGGESCLCEKPLDDDGWRCIRCGKLLAPRLGG